LTLASSLHAKVVASSAELAPNIDTMALWPSENPTHMIVIVCNEQDETQPGLQRVRLSDGQVETILTGNFTRIEVFGDADNSWVEMTVNPSSGNVFSFAPVVLN
jgi:hypothetical protein